ncbi:hypothetical protein D3C84_1179610 [compost metagenome]
MVVLFGRSGVGMAVAVFIPVGGVFVVLVGVLLLAVVVLRAEVAQVQVGQFLHGQAGLLAAVQHAR